MLVERTQTNNASGRSRVISGSILAIILLVISFQGYSKNYSLDAKASKLGWEAKKVTGQHSGTISFLEGSLVAEKGKLTGGKLIVDMNTIVNTDLTDAGYNQKLVGHLKSDDFFGVAKFPQSTLEVKSVTAKSDKVSHISALLTIKGITNPVEFDAEISEASGKLSATGVLVVNRAKFDIKYGSGSFFEGLGDKMIYDDFTLTFSLVAAGN